MRCSLHVQRLEPFATARSIRMSRGFQVAAQEIDELERRGRFLVAAPCYVLVRAHNHELVPVKIA
jgi:hypothetical protein